jgi:4-hydroxymandelate oxidase
MSVHDVSRRAWFSQVTRPTISLGAGQVGAASVPPARAGGPGQGLTPREELVNVLEHEAEARRVLPAAAFAAVAGSERAVIDRMTLQPRVMIPTTDLDLTCRLFGVAHHAPILVAPIAQQGRFHREGAIATARGASTAGTTLIVSRHAGPPLEAVVAATKQPPWFQLFDSDTDAVASASAAVAAGCRVVVVTAGLSMTPAGVATRAAIDWSAIARVARAIDVPVVVKGIRTPADADAAIAQGAEAIICSDYPVAAGAAPGSTGRQGLLGLSAVVDRVRGRVPVLADGDFRRGTDILKALALGGTAVVVGRPVMWGLAAYGAEGVQGVLEMLQTELARYMAMSGRINLAAIDRALVRIHTR